MLAQKQVTSRIHERAYRNRPLSDEQKAGNRQKSKLHAGIEHIFGCIKPVYEMIPPVLHWAAAQRGGDWLDNLIYNLARCEQIVRLKPLPRIAA